MITNAACHHPCLPDDVEPAWTVDLRGRIEELPDEYRAALRGALDDLTEGEPRRRLVPSKTAVLTGRTTRQIGIASTPDRSFTLTRSDTVETVLAAHARR